MRMTGDVWNEDPNLVYTGKITKREKYRGRNKETVDGYVVRWCDGKRENWPYECLVPALVPIPNIPDIDNSVVDVVTELSVNPDKVVVPTNVVVTDQEGEWEGKHLSDSENSDGIIDPNDYC